VTEIVYGRNAVLEAARAGRVLRALVAEGAELARLVRVERVPAARLDSLARGRHQGVAAELRARTFLALRELLAASPTLLLALDSIVDPQNLGAILRTAEAAACDGVILPERRSAPLSGAAVKASSGASELLRISRVPGLPAALAEVKKAGLWCCALDMQGEIAPWDFDLTQAVCLVVGGEGRGVGRLARERCDVRLRLPMRGRVESLNASAAAAALLYEVVRQRAQAASSTTAVP
jgi:23S rRNA (guanosine2251-2'-O)-methyltransferase